MFSLAWPWLLVLLPLPLLVYFFTPVANISESAIRVPFYDAVSKIGTIARRGAKLLRWITMISIWLLLVFAACRPQWVGEITQIPVNGRDLMLAVDVSGSMKTEDMEDNGEIENRLSAVKRVAARFIDTRIGDRLGLILFGTRAYLQSPLTFDRSTVNTLLGESAIGIAGEKTAIGDAIGLALKRLRAHYDEDNSESDDAIPNDKVLILLTDGANTAGIIDPVKAAELATLSKLKIYTIGVGAETMIVNTLFGQRVVQSSADLDENSLTQIAEITGGQYFRATDVASLAEIYTLIDRLEPVKEESKALRPTKDLFYIPLGLAMLITLIFSALSGNLRYFNPIFKSKKTPPEPQPQSLSQAA